MRLQSRLLDLSTGSQMAARWNELWHDSDTRLPVARYEHLIIWQRHFAKRVPVASHRRYRRRRNLAGGFAPLFRVGSRWLAALVPPDE